MGKIVFELPAGQPLAPDDVDGMAGAIEEAEAAGLEGEHVFDASVEDPPHPFWDPVTKRCRVEPGDDAVEVSDLATLPPSGGNDLADPCVVSDLVRGFVSHILILRSEWHEAPADEKIDPTEEIEALAGLLGQVFLGENPAYVATQFNAPHRLGALMRALVPTSGDAGQAFFDWLALQTVRAALELEAGGDEAAVHGQLDAIVADVIGRLLGPAKTD